MRTFNDADRKKKRGRIQLPDNPGNLSDEALTRLEGAVKAAARDGSLACPAAWRVAGDEGVSRLDVGVMIDRIGARVVDCQLGCFKVSKTDHVGAPTDPVDADIAQRVDALNEAGALTCPNIFALAKELGIAPLTVANAANAKRYKFGGCQLGCF